MGDGCFDDCRGWSDRVGSVSVADTLSHSLQDLGSIGTPSRRGKLYNPYEGLHASLDPKVLGTIRLPNAPEHLFSEEATRHKRSWGENLSYYTGLGYLSGKWRVGGPIDFTLTFLLPLQVLLSEEASAQWKAPKRSRRQAWIPRSCG